MVPESGILATRYPTSGELKVDTAELSCPSMNALICETIKKDPGYNYWNSLYSAGRTRETDLDHSNLIQDKMKEMNNVFIIFILVY